MDWNLIEIEDINRHNKHIIIASLHQLPIEQTNLEENDGMIVFQMSLGMLRDGAHCIGWRWKSMMCLGRLSEENGRSDTLMAVNYGIIATAITPKSN